MPDASFAAELVTGTLLHSGQGCVEIAVADSDKVLPLLWPNGYTMESNPMRIFDEGGVELGSENVPVWVGGTEVVGEPHPTCGGDVLFRVVQLTTKDPIGDL